MSVYEAVRVCKQRGNNFVEWLNIPTILRHICCFGLGVLFSLSGFNNDFSPFGVAFTGCVSGKYTVTAALGASLGYFISLDSISALRYTSSTLALAVITTALKAFPSVKNHVATPPAVSFVCIFVTGFAVALSDGITAFSLLVKFCEACVGGACAYVFSKSKAYLTVRGGIKSVTSKEITAIVITCSLLLLSFRYVQLFDVSLAHVIASFLVLLCAYYGREAGGAVVGICCGITMCFGTDDLFILSFYSLGGLLCGAASSFGRFASVCAFSLSGIALGIISNYSGNVYPVVIETAVSVLAFFIISQKFGYQLYEFFSPAVSLPIVDSVKNNIINKLQQASEFSTEICETLESVNSVLAKSEKAKTERIPFKVRSSVCASCGLYDNCWKEIRKDTEENFNKLLELKKQGAYLEYKNVPPSFSGVCIRTENVASSFNKYFSECKMHEKTETRIKEIQTLASEQFTNVSGLLTSLCGELDEQARYDMDVAARCKAAATGMGIQTIDSCCIWDTSEKVVVEMRFRKPADIKVIESAKYRFSAISGRTLNKPEIEDFESYIRAIYREKPEYKVISSGVQFNASGEKYSGDTYTTFEDSKGYFYAIICDGMGTGSKAAVASSLAVNLLEKLIKAGFGINSAINTVNTSLISKSGDECSVTLDLVVIDLHTGRAEFYKCGAQDTLVKRKGKISNLGFDSLPLGILSGVEVSSGTATVGSGDVIVLCSDGVREEDFWQLRNALKVFGSGNVKEFTTDISKVIRNSQPSKNDDFTLLTLAISKDLE